MLSRSHANRPRTSHLRSRRQHRRVQPNAAGMFVFRRARSHTRPHPPSLIPLSPSFDQPLPTTIHKHSSVSVAHSSYSSAGSKTSRRCAICAGAHEAPASTSYRVYSLIRAWLSPHCSSRDSCTCRFYNKGYAQDGPAQSHSSAQPIAG